MKRDKNINFRCTDELKTNLEGLASDKAENGQKVSLSDYVNIALTKHVEEEYKKENKD